MIRIWQTYAGNAMLTFVSTFVSRCASTDKKGRRGKELQRVRRASPAGGVPDVSSLRRF